MADDAENYEEILDRAWDDIPEPQTLPVGEYLLKLRNASYQPPKGKASARVMIVYNVVSPIDGEVDADELAALGDDYDISENRIFHTFWVEDGRAWAGLRRHLNNHAGVDVTGICRSTRASRPFRVARSWATSISAPSRTGMASW